VVIVHLNWYSPVARPVTVVVGLFIEVIFGWLVAVPICDQTPFPAFGLLADKAPFVPLHMS